MNILDKKKLLNVYGGTAYNTGVPKYVLNAIRNFFSFFFR